RSKLAPIANDYEFVLVDLPPGVSMATMMCLAAADHVLVPTQPEPYCLEGTGAVIETLAASREANPARAPLGFVVTMSDGRRRPRGRARARRPRGERASRASRASRAARARGAARGRRRLGPRDRHPDPRATLGAGGAGRPGGPPAPPRPARRDRPREAPLPLP